MADLVVRDKGPETQNGHVLCEWTCIQLALNRGSDYTEREKEKEIEREGGREREMV